MERKFDLLKIRVSWMAPLVKLPTQVRLRSRSQGREIQPCMGLHAEHGAYLRAYLRFSLPLLLPPPHLKKIYIYVYIYIYIYIYIKIKQNLRSLGDSAVEHLPSPQGVILESRDQVPHRAPRVVFTL